MAGISVVLLITSLMLSLAAREALALCDCGKLTAVERLDRRDAAFVGTVVSEETTAEDNFLYRVRTERWLKGSGRDTVAVYVGGYDECAGDLNVGSGYLIYGVAFQDGLYTSACDQRLYPGKADGDIREIESRGRLNVSLHAGAMRLQRDAWEWGPCVEATAAITLAPHLFVSANAWYGWASHGSPEDARIVYGEQTTVPAYKTFAFTFGLGYRTAGLSEPALIFSAGAGVITDRIPIVPAPGASYGIFGWQPNTVTVLDETTLAMSLRAGFEYPLWGTTRAIVEGGFVRSLGSESSSYRAEYFIPITAGVSFNL